jgi:hypothetical protein
VGISVSPIRRSQNCPSQHHSDKCDLVFALKKKPTLRQEGGMQKSCPAEPDSFLSVSSMINLEGVEVVGP